MPQLDEYMGADHIASEQFEPQRQDNFTIIFTDLPGNGEDVLALSLSTLSIPVEANEAGEIQYLNETRKYAGRATYENMTISFRDYVDTGTAEAIRQWRRLVYDPDSGSIGLASIYKKNAQLVLSGPNANGSNVDHGTSTSRQWELYGVWPQQVTWGSLDMGTSEQVQIEVTFCVDKMRAISGLGSIATVSGGPAR